MEMKHLTALFAIPALLACSSPDEMASEVAGAGDESGLDALARQVAADAEAVTFTDNETAGEGLREFSYTWPRQVSAIPALAAQLEAERDRLLAEQKVEWAEAREYCPPESGACLNNTREESWSVVADTERYLSLSANVWTYAGGAHGNYWVSALVWDREEEESLDPLAMFVSAEAFDAAAGEEICQQLNARRAEKRGAPVEAGSDDWANACVGVEAATLLPGSSTGDRFDTLGVYYAPYNAGPYSEGSYEVTIPVSAQVIAAVRPEYRDAFAVK